MKDQEIIVNTLNKIDPSILKGNHFSWLHQSHILLKHCPELFNSYRFNWKDCIHILPSACEELISQDKLNWKTMSIAVAKTCPHLLDVNKFSLEQIESTYPHYKNKSKSRKENFC